jgi:branched-chain amino acid transport system permease protein
LSTFVLLTITGLGIGALYFLIASGLSLIYGLMGVLNFAHGALLTIGTYGSWWIEQKIGIESVWPAFLVAAFCGVLFAGLCATLIEVVLIRPLYRRHIEQVLVTVGLALALVALIEAIWGSTQQQYRVPPGLYETTSVLGANIANNTFLEIGSAVAVFVGLLAFLRYTRYGLIIRAGVENRAMVTALGIDVKKAFTLVFAMGGLAAGIAGVLSGVHYGAIDPHQGTSLLIFAFIVVIIGGLGSIVGSAVAAVVVGLLQQYANYYGGAHLDVSWLGDISVMLLLAVVLLLRPAGLGGHTTRLA